MLSVTAQPLSSTRMCSLQLGQKFPGTGDDVGGQPREACHLNAVGAVRSAVFEPPQEDDLVAHLPHEHVHVLHAGEQVAELGELVVVSGEDGLAAQVLV